jgi:phage tail-like protein
MALTTDDMRATYPFGVYRFVVHIGDKVIKCTSVSGMEFGCETIEYKDGTGASYKMPGRLQEPTITLKRAMMPKDDWLWKWASSVDLNLIEKKDVLISLINNAGTEMLMSWALRDCWPNKITMPSLDDGDFPLINDATA